MAEFLTLLSSLDPARHQGPGAESLLFIFSKMVKAQDYGLSLDLRFGPAFCMCSLAVCQSWFLLMPPSSVHRELCHVCVGEVHGILGVYVRQEGEVHG